MTPLDAAGSAGLAKPATQWSGALCLAVAILALLLFSIDGLAFIVRAWGQPEYSFGPLVPVVSAYMLLSELRRRPLRPYVGSGAPGLAVVVFGLLVGTAGNITQIPYLIAYGMVLAIGGLGLILFGMKQAAAVWPGWLHLMFMLPLPNFLYWHLSAYLQRVSSHIGVSFISAAGIPVFLEGNIIDLGVYKLQVAEACSGLRYLFPMMSFGFLFAVLYRGPLWQKLLLFALTVPITVGINSFRIGAIGVLVNFDGIRQAEGFLHAFEGWILFLTCTLLLYGAGLLMQRWTGPLAHGANILDLEFSGLLRPLHAMRKLPASPGAAIAAALIVVAAAAWLLIPARHLPAPDRKPFAAFPMTLGAWSGERGTVEPWAQKILASDEYLMATYHAPGGRAGVNLFSAYYVSTTDGTGIHSPQICIPGSGWEVSRWDDVLIAPAGGAPPFTVNRAVIQNGTARQLVYYWFEGRGRRVAGETAMKAFTVWDAARTGRADGALVRLVTPLLPGESEQDADRRLTSFVGVLAHVLPAYIPP